MHLDIATLMFAGAFVSVLSGVFLAAAWCRFGEDRSALFWSVANLANAAGIAVFMTRLQLASPVWAIGAVGCFIVSATLIWLACRQFFGRSIPYSFGAAGIVAWLVAAAFPAIGEAESARSILGSSVIAAYLLAAVWELWRDRREYLPARWPMMGLISLHAGVFAVSVVDVLLGAPANEHQTFSTLFSLIHFEHLVFTVGTAVFFIGLMKERIELRHKQAAAIDSLTGLANRGAFLRSADAIFAQANRQVDPVSVLVFDIDNFKVVNDTWGHATGDRVLEEFGTVARKSLRSHDLVGRLGGEEFGVLINRSAPETAYLLAERIREAFMDACKNLGGTPVKATVSVGVATASESDTTLSELLGRADAALYRAKENGRNRTVVQSGPDAAEDDGPHDLVFVRVA